MKKLTKGLSFDPSKMKTPYYIVDEALVRKNLEVLRRVKKETGCKILLAQKAFSMFSMYPLIAEYLDGTTASGLYEARLGCEKFGKETHVFSPAYTDDDIQELLQYADHFVFNSIGQWKKYQKTMIEAGKTCGLRINPEFSTQEHGIYDPCGQFSRLGITIDQFEPECLEGISGLHFHTLCEQNSDDLVTTLHAVEKKFGAYLGQMEWINFGGGHHITRPDYDVDTLITEVNRIQDIYHVRVYLEPGEAVVLNTGFLVSKVIDIIENGMEIAILDASAACHMPDVIEMPYRPNIIGSGLPGEKEYTYRFGGPTCLAGDIIGDYSFDEPIEIGDLLVFCDMSHYSMCKNNTFNGMPLPSIGIATEEGSVKLIKHFGYEDFLNRLS